MRYTLKIARLMAAKTQKEMADALGINRSTYIRMEKDPERVSLGMARKVAEETGIPLEDIFFERDSTLR